MQYTLNGVKGVTGPLHDLINNGHTYIKRAKACRILNNKINRSKKSRADRRFGVLGTRRLITYNWTKQAVIGNRRT